MSFQNGINMALSTSLYGMVLLSFIPSPRLSSSLFCQGLSTTIGKTPSYNPPPTWEDLGDRILPLTEPPTCLDCKLLSLNSEEPNISSVVPEATPTLRLFRERNGWCVYSARLWLALELKGIAYDTILVEARGDTYDGGEEDNSSSLANSDGRPKFLGDFNLPILQYPNDSNLHSAATESTSLEVLQELDARFPGSLPSSSLFGLENGDKLAAGSAEEIFKMIRAFGETVPNDSARESPRAAWLFCNEEGYRLDALPRSTFESFLDTAEALLSKHDDGPFFCGSTLSAADVVWAPLLERYSAQLPCLHRDLRPKDAASYPNLYTWYQAMDLVPAYSCRVKGDAVSWRKVLYVDPWWPREDLWHPRDTVGPKGELWVSEDELCQIVATKKVSHDTWADYVKDRPFVSPVGPGSELAAALTRNRIALTKDATKWMDREGYCTADTSDLDTSFRAIAWMLYRGDLEEHDDDDDVYLMNTTQTDGFVDLVSCVLTYLDDRLCVPRDMGAPSAASLRQLRSKFVDRFGEST